MNSTMFKMSVFIICFQSAKSLQSNKDSRILWAKDELLLTTGFDTVSFHYLLSLFVFFYGYQHNIEIQLAMFN